jgi:RNA polymerase subunit RPABC4/transcription elongation factor Spt4
MIACYNCGQQNAEETRVCRYCGSNLRPQAAQPRDYVPPQTMWAGKPSTAAPIQPYAGAYAPVTGFRCPYCNSTYLPQIGSKISSDGWVVFILLLFFCFPLFWIGLLMKEEYRMCVTCGSKLG